MVVTWGAPPLLAGNLQSANSSWLYLFEGNFSIGHMLHPRLQQKKSNMPPNLIHNHQG
jgi:hypothetical protein